MCTGLWWESQKERDHSADQGVDGRMGSEWILGRLAGGWVGFNWLKIGTGRAVVNAVMNFRVLAPRIVVRLVGWLVC
jgi:hypothetical protein